MAKNCKHEPYGLSNLVTQGNGSRNLPPYSYPKISRNEKKKKKNERSFYIQSSPLLFLLSPER